ncbi:MAG: DUF4038 domain-containing protein [Fimbriimonadaceae bacterium]
MQKIERWGVYELTLRGPATGNPFVEQSFGAEFAFGHRRIAVDGFYDGEGRYTVRFSPEAVGEWTVRTFGSHSDLDGVVREFACTPPQQGNHGPVGADGPYLVHADGKQHLSFGTTCYAWTHQGDALEERTLATLAGAPFNKVRMCVFPKDYDFNKNEPERHAFEKKADGSWDFDRFNPEFFRHFERRVAQLLDLGIEADVILFHPYDRWGYATMPVEVDYAYLRYLIARISAYRNVWWSLANEYDLMNKPTAYWDEVFRLVQSADPHQRLRGIHNCVEWYDHAKPWVTHASIQNHDPAQARTVRERYRKPVVFDECGYEGNIHHGWGNISARRMVRAFWEGFTNGGHVGHGETYLHPDDVLWWSKGGVLHGESPDRIAFLRKIAEDGPNLGWAPFRWNWDQTGVSKGDEVFVTFFGHRTPGIMHYEIPNSHPYRIELIDAWNMTIAPVEGAFSGRASFAMPGREDMAVRLVRI